MKIENDKVVVMHYAVMDSEENLIDSSYDTQPLAFIQGKGFLIPGLEDALLLLVWKTTKSLSMVTTLLPVSI